MALSLIILFLSLGFLSPTTQAAGLLMERIEYTNKNGDTRVSVPLPNGQAPSVYINSQQGIFMSGPGVSAVSQVQPVTETDIRRIIKEIKEKAEDGEHKLNKIALYGSDGQLQGGLTEWRRGSGIFITARHVFQGRNPSDIAASFKKAGYSTDDYKFYELRSALSKSTLDVVLIVPKNKEGEILRSLEFADKKTCDCENKIFYTLREQSDFKANIEANDEYYSPQYGTVGNVSVEQFSKGVIEKIALDQFYLNLDAHNNSTARSSGAIVQVTNAKIRGDDKAPSIWKVGGIVECIIPDHQAANGLKIPGGVRAISSSAIQNAEITAIPLAALSAEPLEKAKDGCIKIDARGAGGL